MAFWEAKVLSHRIMPQMLRATPAILNERYYDLATLTKLNKARETREDLYPGKFNLDAN